MFENLEQRGSAKFTGSYKKNKRVVYSSIMTQTQGSLIPCSQYLSHINVSVLFHKIPLGTLLSKIPVLDPNGCQDLLCL